MGMIFAESTKVILEGVAVSVPVALFIWYYIERKRTPQAAKYILVAGVISMLIIAAWLPMQRQEIHQLVKTGIEIGDIKSIRAGAQSKKDLAVFREKAGLDEFLDAMGADDSQKLISLYLSGRHFEIPEGTKVQIVDTGLFRNKLEVYKITVLEGTYFGHTGWVMDINLK